MPTITIEPVRGSNRVDAAMRQLRGMIEQGGLTPGDRLPGELELADRLAVSRTVVREAIGRLQMIGLLTVERGRKGGTFVADPDTVSLCADVVRSSVTLCERDTRQFAEFRTALETHAARRAAELATEEDIAELQALCDEPVGCSDRAELIQIDLRFHRKLAAVAGNEIIMRTLDVSREFIAAMIRDTGPNDILKNYDQHQSIVDAIHRHDADAAEHAMRLHMDAVIQGLNEQT